MRFNPGDRVQLTLFHRTEDHNAVVVACNVGDRFEVAGHVTGSPDVRCRFPRLPNRTLLLPVAKLTRCQPDGDDANDGDHTGGGPVGEAATVPGPGGRRGYPPRRRAA